MQNYSFGYVNGSWEIKTVRAPSRVIVYLTVCQNSFRWIWEKICFSQCSDDRLMDNYATGLYCVKSDGVDQAYHLSINSRNASPKVTRDYGIIHIYILTRAGRRVYPSHSFCLTLWQQYWHSLRALLYPQSLPTLTLFFKSQLACILSIPNSAPTSPTSTVHPRKSRCMQARF
jgi:hypothetical protein